MKAEANDSSLVDQSKREFSDGNDVIGQYKVLLPDGRLQTVTYTSGPDGFKAEVQYTQTNIVRTILNHRPNVTATTTTSTAKPSTTLPSSLPAAELRSMPTVPPLQPHQEEALRTRTKSRSRLRLRTWDESSASEEETGSSSTEPALTVINNVVPNSKSSSSSSPSTWTFDKIREKLSSKNFKF